MSHISNLQSPKKQRHDYTEKERQETLKGIYMFKGYNEVFIKGL